MAAALFFDLVLLAAVVLLIVNLLTLATCSEVEPLLVYVPLEVHPVAPPQTSKAPRLFRP